MLFVCGGSNTTFSFWMSVCDYGSSELRMEEGCLHRSACSLLLRVEHVIESSRVHLHCVVTHLLLEGGKQRKEEETVQIKGGYVVFVTLF